LLLTVIDFHWLFGGTVVGFLCSAALVVSVLTMTMEPAAATARFRARSPRSRGVAR
jgi:hypothetical protein